MIICKNCGAELPDQAKFCTKCGYAIFDEEPAVQPEAQAAPESTEAYGDWNREAETAAYQPYPPKNPAENYGAQPVQDPYQNPPVQAYTYQDSNAYREPQPAEGTAAADLGRTAMILAIIGAALSELGIPGIILCAIAKGKVKEWEQKYGPAAGTAKAAKIVSTIGLVFSIIMTVFWVFYLIFFIALGVGIASGGLEDFFEDLIYDLR